MKVLFADDEEFFRMMVREVLRARVPDVMVVEAADGDAALAELRREHFDCLVSDLVMPGTDGAGLLAAMINERMRVPVVFVSAHGGEHVRIPGLPRQVTKPADLGALCATVGELLVEPAAARDAMPTLMGLVHVLRWEQRTCCVRVRERRDGAAWRGHLSLDRGRLHAAHLTFDPAPGDPPGGARAELFGAEAAVEAFSARAPYVELTAPLEADVDDAGTVREQLEQLFARAAVRRRSSSPPPSID